MFPKLQHNGGGGINGLKAEEVRPRLVFHYGVPPESSSLAYDPIQHILAISTRLGGEERLVGAPHALPLIPPLHFFASDQEAGIDSCLMCSC